MLKIKNLVFAILLLLPFFVGAQTLVYTPTNPSFIGGNAFNGTFLLNSAQAQNTFKDPNNQQQQPTDLQNFKASLNRQLLDRLSTSLFNQQFGDQSLTNGTFKFGSLVVDVGNASNGVNINILDITNGDQTQISLPNF